MIQKETKEKILQKAISLEKFGMRDLAWEKEDAKHLIMSLMFDYIGILGGDVYKVDLTRIIPTYDNWSCEQKKEESKGDYFFRSKSETFEYINQYPVEPNEQILFSIVFDEIIDS